MSMYSEIITNDKRTSIDLSGYVAKNLLRDIPALSPNHSNSDVHSVLYKDINTLCLPVVDGGRPIGLINRHVFTTGMAKPFAHDLFAKKTCHTFMNNEPVVVNQHTSIEELSHKVVSGDGPSRLSDGFIITDDDGKYLGVGTNEDLIKLIVELQAEKTRVIAESINYAKGIQRSFLRPSDEDLKSALSEYVIHWEPRDNVGGDYYFCEKFNDGVFFALIDCTGHGVPGAFMTLIIASFLGHILREHDRRDPAALLAAMNKKLKFALRQLEANHELIRDSDIGSDDQSDDGMDSAFCWIEPRKMIYAGAKTPIFFMDHDGVELEVIEGDRKGIGYISTSLDYTWTNREIDLPKGRCVYLTTDGIIDQIGENKKIAFGKRRLSEVLTVNHQKTMAEQRDAVLNTFYAWQGKQRRRDDVCFFGFRA